MEGSIRGDATPQIGTRAIFLFSKEEPVFRDFFQRDGIAGSAVSSFRGVVPRFGECAMGSQELTADSAAELPDTLARIEGFSLIKAPRFSVPFGK